MNFTHGSENNNNNNNGDLNTINKFLYEVINEGKNNKNDDHVYDRNDRNYHKQVLLHNNNNIRSRRDAPKISPWSYIRATGYGRPWWEKFTLITAEVVTPKPRRPVPTYVFVDNTNSSVAPPEEEEHQLTDNKVDDENIAKAEALSARSEHSSSRGVPSFIENEFEKPRNNPSSPQRLLVYKGIPSRPFKHQHKFTSYSNL